MQHPDEGTIHAWLDGALPPEEARALETHVAGCERCAALVVEARGYLAGASRILSSLDDAPRGVVPTAASPAASPMRFRAARYRIAAALVILAGGAYVVAREAPPDDALLDRALESAVESPAVSTVVTAAPEGGDAGGAATRGDGAAERQVAGRSERDAPADASVRDVGTATVRAPAPSAAPAAPAREQLGQQQDYLARREAVREPVAADSVAVGDMRSEVSSVAARSGGRSDSSARSFKVLAERAAPPAAEAAPPRVASQTAARREREQSAAVRLSGIATPAQAPSWAAPACYAIDLGALDAKSDEDRRALTPPSRIRLETTTGAEALERETFAVSPVPGTPSSGHRFAEWKPAGDSTLVIRFTDGLNGIELALVRDGQDLRGRARGLGDAAGTIDAPVRLTRIACDDRR